MIIKNSTIIDFTNFKLIENADIHIEKGIISNIEVKNKNGKYEDLKFNKKSQNQNLQKNNIKNKNNLQNTADSFQIIDGTNYYVLPGLTNMHAHVAMTLLRGSAEDVNSIDWFNNNIWKYEKNLNEQDVYYGTLLGSIEMLKNGVTFVADHYFSMDKAYKAYLEAGIRADLAWALFGIGDNSEINFKKAMEFINKYNNKSKMITISLGPHSPYICPENFLKKINKISEEKELKIHIHISEEKWQIEKSIKEKGITPILYLDKLGIIKENTILAHAYYATDEELKLIKKRKAVIAHAAKTYMRFGFVKDLLHRAINEGVKISLATDGPASNGDLSIFEVAKMASLLSKIVTKNAENGKFTDIFPLMFNGLKNIGIVNSGKIKEGNIADIILIKKNSINLNPTINIFTNIIYNISSENIDYVIVDGKVIVYKGKHLYVDTEILLKEVNKIKNRLLKANGSPMQKFGI